MAPNKVWHPLNQPMAGLLNSISSIVDKEEWKHPGSLTSLREAKTILLVSDYGGEHRTARYQSLSFLITAADYLSRWDHSRLIVRRRVLQDHRRMAYKRLAEPCRAKALVPFLRAADMLPGLLLTVLIDHRLSYLFVDELDPTSRPIPELDTSKWKIGPLEKLLRVAGFGSMLIAGLSAPGQDVLWFTDEDQIAPNDTMHREAVHVIAQFLNRLVTHNMGHFRLGTTKCDNGSMAIEDLAAVPDLAAGTLAEVAAAAQSEGGFAINHLRPLSQQLPAKVAIMLNWLAWQRSPLQKRTLVLEASNPGNYQVRLLHMMPEPRQLITDL